jgi:hypothetical protein
MVFEDSPTARMRLMRRLLIMLCLACSSLAAQKTRASIALPGFRDKFPIEDYVQPFSLDAPMRSSFVALQAAFADLKLPLTVADTTTWVVGQERVAGQISYAGLKMSKLFDCGQAANGLQNADTFRLLIVALALLDPIDATHTKVQLGVVAGGDPPGGPRGNAVQCGSTGALEAKLIELANKHLMK